MAEIISDEISLANINHGAVVERADYYIKEVIRNINDLNTVAETVRELTIKLKFKPSKDRSMVAIGVEIPPPKLGTFEPFISRAVVNEYNTANEICQPKQLPIPFPLKDGSGKIE